MSTIFLKNFTKLFQMYSFILVSNKDETIFIDDLYRFPYLSGRSLKIIDFEKGGMCSVAYRTSTGIILRNPAEKAKRFSRQMKSGKVRETGEEIDCCGMAYRAGYLQARQDSANAYNANKGTKAKKKNNKKGR